MNQKYKINDVATMHNISKKALMHYEKIGLFVPGHIDKETKYRYYNRVQFPRLKNIIYLKKVGLPLDDIKGLLETLNHETFIKGLEDHRERISQEIESNVKVMNKLDHLLGFYNKAKYLDDNDFYRPAIRILPERKIFYTMSEPGADNSKMMQAYRKGLKYLDDHDIFSHKEYGGIYFEEGIKNGFENHAGGFISVPLENEVPNFKIFPEGKYISLFTKGTYYNTEGIKFLLKWVKENNYEIEGPIIDLCIVDANFTKEDDLLYMELQVKVK